MNEAKNTMLISPQKVKSYGLINLNVNESEVGNAIRISLKIRNMGVVKNSDTNVQATNAGDVKYMAEYYETFFYDAVNKLMDFLCENKEAYVEVPDGFCTCSSKPRYARTSLWLGK